VRNFFHSCRNQFKLDDALRDYEQSCSETVQDLFKSLPAGTQLLVVIHLFIYSFRLSLASYLVTEKILR
jgi:hypothetical protein